jgi:hypothetical protein
MRKIIPYVVLCGGIWLWSSGCGPTGGFMDGENTNENENENENENQSQIENESDDDAPLEEEATASVDVLLFDGFYYPTSLFTCAMSEDEQPPDDSCPDGAGCDEYHWHRGPFGAIAAVQEPESYSQVLETMKLDTNSCRCGHGKVSEVTRTTIEVLESDLINYEEFHDLSLDVDGPDCPPAE